MTRSIGPLNGLVTSSPLILIYLLGFNELAVRTDWYIYLILPAIPSALLMFLWIIRFKQLARLMRFHDDMEENYGPGAYFLANLFPFAREADLHAGFHFELIEDLRPRRVGGPEFHHHTDTRDIRTQVNVSTDSFLKADIHRASNGLWERLSTIRGRDGEVEYYRLGRLCFFFLTLAALVGNVVAPNRTKQGDLVRSASLSTITQPASNVHTHDITVLAQLTKGVQPIFPSEENFKAGAVWSAFLLGERKYVRYKEPGSEETPQIRSVGKECFIIPAGRKLRILASSPPVFVANMKPDAKYHQKYVYATWWKKKLGTLMRKEGAPEWTSVWNSESWETLFDEWHTVDTVMPVVAEALPLEKIPMGKLGGLVCF